MSKLTVKVILLGDSSVGKTCILNRFHKDEYQQSTMATVSAGFAKKTFHLGGYKVKMQLWDTAGQEKFASLSRMFYRNCHACLFVFDLTQIKTLESLTTWKSEFIEIGGYVEGEIPPLFLIGNKKDLKKGSRISQANIDAWCKDANAEYHIVSASKGIGFEELFQQVCEMAMNFSLEHAKLNNNAILEKNKEEPEITREKGCCI